MTNIMDFTKFLMRPSSIENSRKTTVYGFTSGIWCKFYEIISCIIIIIIIHSFIHSFIPLYIYVFVILRGHLRFFVIF